MDRPQPTSASNQAVSSKGTASANGTHDNDKASSPKPSSADPKLLLADEPTGNKNSTNGAQVMEVLWTLNEAGSAIVMVTHSPVDAEYSSR